MKVLNHKVNYVVYLAIVLGCWGVPVHASCYGWNPGNTATINLDDPKNGYYRIWKDKKRLQLAAKLRHGTKIKVIRFVEGTCGGDVYLAATVNGRTIGGWTDSDNLAYLTR